MQAQYMILVQKSPLCKHIVLLSADCSAQILEAMLMMARVTAGQMVREQEQRIIQSHRNLWENLCFLQCTLGTPKWGVHVTLQHNPTSYSMAPSL